MVRRRCHRFLNRLTGIGRRQLLLRISGSLASSGLRISGIFGNSSFEIFGIFGNPDFGNLDNFGISGLESLGTLIFLGNSDNFGISDLGSSNNRRALTETGSTNNVIRHMIRRGDERRATERLCFISAMCFEEVERWSLARISAQQH